MAKIGEGDPRWLVQNREDGTNVNNWHWSERDCMGWTKTTLTTLFTNLSIIDDPQVGTCKVTSIPTISGECTANNRKGKTIFFYEVELKLNWEGKLNGSDVTVKGSFNVPYISEENDDDKAEVQVSCDGKGAEHDKMTDLVRAAGIPIVRKKVAEYLHQLKNSFTLQRSAGSTSSAQESKPEPAHAEPAKPVQAAPAPSKPSKPNCKNISLTEEFMCSPEDAYNFMTNPQMLNAVTQGGAVMDPVVGGKFSLFNGAVTGENVKLEAGKTIVQKWRFSTWPEGHYSTVTIDFESKKSKTILKLAQQDVPVDDVSRTEQGWRQNIWGRAKAVFGYGPSSSVF